jgi:hypothetical protein
MLFLKHKRSWYWLAMWALVFAGFLYSVSRFFLHAVDKEAKDKPKKQAEQVSTRSWEEMFV